MSTIPITQPRLTCVFPIFNVMLSWKNLRSKFGYGLLSAALTLVSTLAATLFCVFSSMPLSGDYVVRIGFAVSPVFLSGLLEGRDPLRLIPALSVLVLTAAALTLSCLHVFSPDPGAPVILAMLLTLVILTGKLLWRQSGAIRKFDGALSAKATLGEFADIMYYASLILLICIGKFVCCGGGWVCAVGSALCLLLICGLVGALYMRRRDDKVFLLYSEREELFVDNPGLCAGVTPGDISKLSAGTENLFRRLNAYFENFMPFLNPELTLGDVAKALLTNKVYLSRTINECTGRNFCQFVNYYRVKHAIKLFRDNNLYKIEDLSRRSGFNSVRAFMMAFRLFMNVSPSQWCRLNRGKPSDQAK